jgi:hypothetical protein
MNTEAKPAPSFDAATWPKDPANGRFLCTLAQPMPHGAGGRWSHADLADAGGCAEGCCDDYRCRACGVEFRVEAAD